MTCRNHVETTVLGWSSFLHGHGLATKLISSRNNANLQYLENIMRNFSYELINGPLKLKRKRRKRGGGQGKLVSFSVLLKFEYDACTWFFLRLLLSEVRATSHTRLKALDIGNVRALIGRKAHVILEDNSLKRILIWIELCGGVCQLWNLS